VINQFIEFMKGALEPRSCAQRLRGIPAGSGVKLLVNKCRAEPITPQAAVTVNWLRAY